MARPGLSPEQIRDAIAALSAEGQDVTVPRIRERLGSGSYSTIAKVLSEWRDEQKKELRPDVPELPDNISALFAHVWRQAWSAADGLFEASRIAFQQEREEYAKTKEEMTAEMTRLESDGQTLQEEVEAARQETGKVQEELAAIKRKLVEVNTVKATLTTEYQREREENKNARAELTTWVARATKAETQLQATEKQMGQEITHLTEQLAARKAGETKKK